jgi:hypothetical protein
VGSETRRWGEEMREDCEVEDAMARRCLEHDAIAAPVCSCDVIRKWRQIPEA